MMFVRHNTANWQEPGDYSFEPSPVWLDDPDMATDEPAQNFLRNILLKSKGSMSQTRTELDQKRNEVENARKARQAIREGRDKRDEVECVRAVFGLMEQMHEVEHRKTIAEVEVLTITKAVGDVSIGAQNHNFKNETFKIPTNCDFCGDRIWGLSAKGFSCRDCGYTCHSKCQMKAPADCPGESNKDERKKLKAERQAAAAAPTVPMNGGGQENDLPRLSHISTADSMNTLSSGFSATAHRSISGTTIAAAPDDGASLDGAPKPAPSTRKPRILAPPPTTYVSPDSNGAEAEALTSPKGHGKMTYSYEKNAPGEISVQEGSDITILEPDGTISIAVVSSCEVMEMLTIMQMADGQKSALGTWKAWSQHPTSNSPLLHPSHRTLRARPPPSRGPRPHTRTPPPLWHPQREERKRVLPWRRSAAQRN